MKIHVSERPVPHSIKFGISVGQRDEIPDAVEQLLLTIREHAEKCLLTHQVVSIHVIASNEYLRGVDIEGAWKVIQKINSEAKKAGKNRQWIIKVVGVSVSYWAKLHSGVVPVTPEVADRILSVRKDFCFIPDKTWLEIVAGLRY